MFLWDERTEALLSSRLCNITEIYIPELAERGQECLSLYDIKRNRATAMVYLDRCPNKEMHAPAASCDAGAWSWRTSPAVAPLTFQICLIHPDALLAAYLTCDSPSAVVGGPTCKHWCLHKVPWTSTTEFGVVSPPTGMLLGGNLDTSAYGAHVKRPNDSKPGSILRQVPWRSTH